MWRHLSSSGQRCISSSVLSLACIEQHRRQRHHLCKVLGRVQKKTQHVAETRGPPSQDPGDHNATPAGHNRQKGYHAPTWGSQWISSRHPAVVCNASTNSTNKKGSETELPWTEGEMCNSLRVRLCVLLLCSVTMQAGIRTTTGSLSVLARRTPYQLNSGRLTTYDKTAQG